MEANKIKTFQTVYIARLKNASQHNHFNFGLHMLVFNPLNAELNSTCHLLALLGAHHILHVSRIRVKNRDNFMFSFEQLIRRQTKSRPAIFMNKTVLSTKSIFF
jgi:hypothetical protein